MHLPSLPRLSTATPTQGKNFYKKGENNNSDEREGKTRENTTKGKKQTHREREISTSVSGRHPP